jgi:hypothetical protein
MRIFRQVGGLFWAARLDLRPRPNRLRPHRPATRLRDQGGQESRNFTPPGTLWVQRGASLGWVWSGGSNLAPGPLGSVADRHRGWLLLCPSSSALRGASAPLILSSSFKSAPGSLVGWSGQLGWALKEGPTATAESPASTGYPLRLRLPRRASSYHVVSSYKI